MNDTITPAAQTHGTNGTNATNGTARAKSYYARAVQPPVDVFENADQILIVADIPGIPGGAIDVKVENGTLTLQTKRSLGPGAPAPLEDGTALAREYDEVDFARTFQLPPGIDAANISAEAKNGTVVVVLPKAAAARSRTITVRKG